MTNNDTNNLQDVFLNDVRKNETPVSVRLLNGFQLKGTVKGFDSFTLILEFSGKEHLVYKHAIATVTPLKSLAHSAEE